MKIIVALLLLFAFTIIFCIGTFAYEEHQETLAFEVVMDSRMYNTRNYKCASIKDYDNGKTTVEYYLHKRGC